MDGILVQDSDWSRKLSLSLYDLLKKKLLCDLGIVCSAKNDVANIKSNEVVMVHRCVLSAASETIKHLSIGGQVYNLVKINGVNISIDCWDDILQFVYCGQTTVNGLRLCELKKASQVLQIKSLEQAVNVHHATFSHCQCKDLKASSHIQTADANFLVSSDTWVSDLFVAMLELLVKQSLCNMTIITDKGDRSSSEILAHLCMCVAASSIIRELVLQGSNTYNSVKIDSISYNTWLYLLEYIYTSRVSIVKTNITDVWVASRLLQIEGLANAVSPFANQIATNQTLRNPKEPASSVTKTQPQQSYQINDCTVGKITDQNLSNISDSSVDGSNDFLGIKSETSSGCGDIESMSHVDAGNDDHAFDILNTDSCDVTGVDKLALAGVENLDVSPIDKPLRSASRSSSPDSVLQISSLLQTSNAAANSVSLSAPSVQSPAASTLPQKTEHVPVQPLPGAVILQGASQLGM